MLVQRNCLLLTHSYLHPAGTLAEGTWLITYFEGRRTALHGSLIFVFGDFANLDGTIGHGAIN